LTHIRLLSQLLQKDFIEFEARPPSFQEFIKESRDIEPVIPVNTERNASSPTGYTQEDVQFCDDTIPEDEKIKLDSKQPVKLPHIDIKALSYFEDALLKQSILVRMCAAATQSRLLMVKSAAQSSCLFISMIESSIVSSCMYLNKIQDKPIEELLQITVDVQPATFSEAICNFLARYEVSEKSSTDPKCYPIRLILSDACFMYAEYIYSRTSSTDAKTLNDHLSRCNHLVSLSLSLALRTDESIDVSERLKFQTSLLDQLQRRGGFLKPIVIPAARKGQTNTASHHSSLIPTGSSAKLGPSVSASDITLSTPHSPASPVVWAPNTADCTYCHAKFGMFTWRHHCRGCGTNACGTCCKLRVFPDRSEYRICNQCFEDKAMLASIHKALQ
jgi:hypothetical protein